MSQRILSALGILSADMPTGNMVWVDRVNGVDGLAMRGRMTIPFRTLGAAKTAAQSGDTIMVLPGTYNEKNLLKNGVNWHFLPGATVEYNGAADGGIFDTSSFGANAAVASLVSGHGDFRMLASSTNSHVVNTATPGAGGSNLIIQARSMVSVAAAVKLADPHATLGKCFLDVGEMNATGADVIVVNGGVGTNLVRVAMINTSAVCALNITYGNLDLTAHRLSASDSAIKVNTGGTGNVTVRAYEIFSQNKSAVHYNSSSYPKLTLMGARIVSAGTVADDGRAVRIDTSASNKVKLANCALIASSAATESISAASSINVHLIGGSVGNKDKHGNITFVGNTWNFSSAID